MGTDKQCSTDAGDGYLIVSVAVETAITALSYPASILPIEQEEM